MQTINGRDITGKRQLESSIHTMQAEVDGMLLAAKNSMGNQLGELEGRLADAENAALKGGKASVAKMEMKIRELEAELASTQSRTGEAAKALQRGDRKAKELAFAQGEDRKNQDRM